MSREEKIKFRKGTTLVDICKLQNVNIGVSLEVGVGFEQLADILILIEKNEIRHYSNTELDAIQPTFLGNSDELKKKRLRVSIMVKDINEYNNDTSAGIIISSGEENPYLRGLTKSVTADGGLIWYTFDIHFK